MVEPWLAGWEEAPVSRNDLFCESVFIYFFCLGWPCARGVDLKLTRWRSALIGQIYDSGPQRHIVNVSSWATGGGRGNAFG